MKKKNIETLMNDRIALDRLNRRMFIRGSMGWVAMPFLASLIPESVLAQTAVPKRFIGITSADQFPMQLLFPRGFVGRPISNAAGYNSATTAFSEGGFNFSETNLASIIAQNGSISNALGAGFNPYVSRLIVYGGLDFPGRLDHGLTPSMGNTAGSHLGSKLNLKPNYTLDRVLVRQPQVYANASDSAPGLGLRLGELTNSNEDLKVEGGQGISAGFKKMAPTFAGNLSQIFQNYFKASGGSTTVNTGDSTRSKIVDQVARNAAAVRNSSRTSSKDKERLDEYLNSLSEVQTRLRPQATQQSACPQVANDYTTLQAAVGNLGSGVNGVSRTTTYYRDLVRLVTLFIKCDLCRVFNVGMTSSVVSPNEAAYHTVSPRPWHLEWGHGNKYDKILPVQKWILDNVVLELVKSLDTLEGAEKFIDNTLIYFSPEMSWGHSGSNMCGIVIGDKKINGGRALNFADYSKGVFSRLGDLKAEDGPGQPLNRLWISILEAMGVPMGNVLGKYGSQAGTFGQWRSDYGNGWESVFSEVARAQNIGRVLPRVLKA